MLAGLRARGPKRLGAAVERLARQRDTQVNTLENYTRFPLAVLEWSGWTEKIRDSETYGRPIVFHRLTSVGAQQVRVLKTSRDLRAGDLPIRNSELRQAAAKLGAISMLERAGFDSSGLAKERNDWVARLLRQKLLRSPAEGLLFSPFQELDPTELVTAFGEVASEVGASSAARRDGPSGSAIGRDLAETTTVRLLSRAAPSPPEALAPESRVEGVLRSGLARGRPIEDVADALCAAFENSNKAEFYPAVADLFRLLGYDCQASRVGVNYQRWDAFILHPTDSIPIEIKSPGEERFISVKGVRQALENKVVLTSREVAPSRRATTSLVVGFLPPNDRAEVAGLVSDIHRAFGVSIGVIDFRSLALLAAGALAGRGHDTDRLVSLKGFIDVATT